MKGLNRVSRPLMGLAAVAAILAIPVDANATHAPAKRSADTAGMVFQYTGRMGIWVATAGGRDRREIGFGTEPALSPNGRYVVAIGGDARDTVLLRSSGRATTVVGGLHGASIDDTEWSPDSRYLAVAWTRGVMDRIRTGVDIVAVPSGRVVGTIKGPSRGADELGTFAPSGPDRFLMLRPPNAGANANTSLVVVSDRRGHWRITSTLIAGEVIRAPVWSRYGIFYDRVTDRVNPNASPVYQIMLLRHGRITQITHTRPGVMSCGYEPIAASARGTRLVADFVGQTNQTMTINVLTGRSTVIAGVESESISQNGAEVLGMPVGGRDQNVIEFPFAGGAKKVLVKGADWGSWRS